MSPAVQEVELHNKEKVELHNKEKVELHNKEKVELHNKEEKQVTLMMAVQLEELEDPH
jgi:hypothetical protein